MVDRRLAISRAQEERAATRYGGRRVRGSGGGPIHKGDAVSSTMMVECKGTSKKQITIKLADLEKLRHEALLSGRGYVLQFQLGNRDYAILPDEDLAEIVAERDALRNEVQALRRRPGENTPDP